MALLTFNQLKDAANIPVSKPTFFKFIKHGLLPNPYSQTENGTNLWTPLQAVYLKSFFKDIKLNPQLSRKKNKVFCVLLQKGGVGKTSLTINLATAVGMLTGKKILIIDADQQASASLGLGVRNLNIDAAMLLQEDRHASIFDVLFNEAHPQDVIQHKVVQAKMDETLIDVHLDIMPSGGEMAHGEHLLFNVISRHDRIKQLVIKPVLDYYDYIFIDCPPSLSIVSLNALFASDYLLIPMIPTAFAFDGLLHLFNTIESIQSPTKGLDHPIGLAGVAVLNKSQTIAHDSIIKRIEEVFGDKVFKNHIPARTMHQEAEMLQQPIASFRSDLAVAYLDLAKEFLQRIN